MNRPSEKNPAKIAYFLSIIFGAIILFSADTLSKTYAAYATIAGFALLMFGLYKSTTSWVTENPHPKKNKEPYEFYEEDKPANKENNK
jgi:hypothetical protein